MNQSDKIYVAGHRGMVGSAIVRRLQKDGFNNIVTRGSKEMDLREQQPVRDFFASEKPDVVVLAAAKVGGIQANNVYRAQFLYENLMIQNNVIDSLEVVRLNGDDGSVDQDIPIPEIGGGYFQGYGGAVSGTNVTTTVALDDGKTVTSRGWYRIEPGKCLHPDVSGQPRRLFSFAEAVDTTGRTIKKVPRYQQFAAVNKAIDRARTHSAPLERGGVVWHTQGSGKSITMLWLALKLRHDETNENPTILIVTDRRDLDDQISRTFTNCGYPSPLQATSVAHLRELLNGPTGKTVMTTVQKFQELGGVVGEGLVAGLVQASHPFVRREAGKRDTRFSALQKKV